MIHFCLQIICFIIFIISVHYLWNLFKDKFTIKKTKDLNTTIEKYKLLVETKIQTPPLEEEENINTKEIENDLNQFINELLVV